MYKKVSTFFEKPTPKAEVFTANPPKYEENVYFQLLADYGIRPNEPQKEAIQAVDGPVLVLAGAGSGMDCRRY